MQRNERLISSFAPPQTWRYFTGCGCGFRPKKGCNYPYDELCGCGIGFKLIQALGKNRQQTTEDLVPYLDLVAAAIAADIVPMTGKRVLAHYGFK
jgi:single-stranded-DNA-specific exonuclease